MEGGAREGDETQYRAGRIEVGRPEYGEDFDDTTLPPEAGLVDRGIDHQKGCYTGQEIVVRIRDRGHPNRHLRGLDLGTSNPPLTSAGALLFGTPEDPTREVGGITSVAFSTVAARGLALGMVRREVPLGATVRIGAADGPEARVAELRDGWWTD
jgi:folate-binding protein YgfZ